MNSAELIKSLKQLADSEIAEHSQRFFKTGKGDYGEGDVFLGIRVPVLRKLAKENRACELKELVKVLHSKYHEARLLALLILVEQYQKGDEGKKVAIFDLYLKSTNYINNWDLVDCSAHKIVGPHVFAQDHKLLYTLAKSECLWQRRIAMMSTYYFIKKESFEPTLKLAEILLTDSHDLMHKVVGWMLRELGKKDGALERKFLKQHAKTMPRTMLRYAIEKFPKKERLEYLNKISR